jgi:6-pyruvoyltetrahydropterin/6-carboxytetrahydropterin synthase
MYTVIIKESFEASHHVRMPCGSIEPPHCHKWKLETAVSCKDLDENGFAVEFLSLQKLIRKTVSNLNGKDINNITYFQANFPTAEIVSKYIYDSIKKSLPSGVTLEYTLLEEAPGCIVKYTDH